uniref:Uncharacterized protein n=1 Tax=Hyaloperonospora arabidopsidis (strain Emoy2) TaxID=559515 RepID=M4B8M2_HYAAE
MLNPQLNYRQDTRVAHKVDLRFSYVIEVDILPRHPHFKAVSNGGLPQTAKSLFLGCLRSQAYLYLDSVVKRAVADCGHR